MTLLLNSNPDLIDLTIERLKNENCSIGDKMLILGMIEETIKWIGKPKVETQECKNEETKFLEFYKSSL